MQEKVHILAKLGGCLYPTYPNCMILFLVEKRNGFKGLQKFLIVFVNCVGNGIHAGITTMHFMPGLEE